MDFFNHWHYLNCSAKSHAVNYYTCAEIVILLTATRSAQIHHEYTTI